MNTANAREFPFSFQHFDRLRKISISHTGILVPDSKQEMFYARLAKRLRHLKIADFDSYIRYLESHWDEEGTDFINALTTNLTAFFRENHHFEFLASQVVPACRQAGVNPVRVWSAGCSTGEEPYSIAMTLSETCGQHRLDWELTATDLDTDVLSKASRGVYRLERLDGVSMERKKRFFQKGTGKKQGYARARASLRETMNFRQLNLVKPFSLGETFDVIFCRNVVIYFDRDTKSVLVNQFAEHLKPEGYLVMGHSESLHGISDRFRSLGQTIYQRIG